MKSKILVLTLVLLSLGLSCTVFAKNSKKSIKFTKIPGNGYDIASFEIGKTEITNEQYVKFLNAALRKGMIRVGEVVGPDDEEYEGGLLLGYSSYKQQLIYDKNDNMMLNLLGVRVTNNHDRDEYYELWEMENPLNRSMIEYDSDKERFRVIDPKKVDWSIYFDEDNLPEGIYPADVITDWCELNKFWPDGVELDGREIVTFSKSAVYVNGDEDAGIVRDDITFAGHLDLDCKLPSLGEVKRWPVNHILFYGAKAFADFYGYDLPTLDELQWAMKGGEENVYGTDDGTITPENTVYNGGWPRFVPGTGIPGVPGVFQGKHKGHPQPVASFPPNPYGVYNLAGSVVEYTKTKDFYHDLGCRQAVVDGWESFVRLGGAWPRPEEACGVNACINTSVNIGNDHFGFRVVKRKHDRSIEFADIPGNGDDVEDFQMSITEITNQQYVNFLNAALRKNMITVGEVEPLDESQAAIEKIAAYSSRNQQLIYDKNGNWMIDLLGVRVTGDHDKDGIFELLEMENPLSRVMIEYDSEKERFRVVNPKKVDWSIYFDEENLPEGVKPADKVTNWHELHKFWPKGEKEADDNLIYAGPLDSDHKLPSLKEVKSWPVNHILYYGAKAFADFYAYDLPTLEELQWAAEGGYGYEYGTFDGSIHENNVVCNWLPGGPWGPNGPAKGHVQPVGTFEPNPYGVYDLSGNVYEWTKTINNDDLNCADKTDPGWESFVRIGGAWNYNWEAQSLATKNCKDTSINRGNDHFGFRVVKKQ